MIINDSSGVPRYRQVAAAVREAIRTGRYQAGNQLPPADELGAEYGVGRVTALQAIADLQAEGFVITKRGRGTFIRNGPEYIRMGSDRYTRSTHGRSPNVTDGRAAGWEPQITAQISTTSATADLARRLRVAEGDELSEISYYWTDGTHPVQLSTQWEPLAVTKGTAIEVPPGSGMPDVITRFDSIGIHIDRVDEETRTRMPTASESEDLALSAGTPVLHIERTHWAGKTPVETATIIIRGDRMVIVASHNVPPIETGS